MGTVVAPRAPIAFPLLARLAVETVVFGAAVGALVVVDRVSLAVLLGVCSVVNRVLGLLWEQ